MATVATEAAGEVPGASPKDDRGMGPDGPSFSPPRWAAMLLIAGLYLTFRGYHAFDGDQAYRLPLLLHRQDPMLYATDPFVRAVDVFNPHRGYLTLIDLASRPLGLAAGLAGLFALTFGATALGVDRLARSVWPGSGGKAGLVALGLVLLAKAGNVGTNHLFEATLLDRLMGFALGWLALAWAVGEPRRGAWAAAPWIGLAALIHPSVGLQLGLTLAATWAAWAIWPSRSGVRRPLAVGAILGLILALAPGLAMMAGQGGRLFRGLPEGEFRLLAVMVQGPQHMLPSTWRMSQWLAWACYPVLGVLAVGEVGRGGPRRPWPAARVRLAVLIGVNLASLGLAYLAVEVMGDLRVTVFQPFRMATLARGLALVALSGRVAMLWDRGDLASRARAVLLGVGLSGDWILVVATAADASMCLGEWVVGWWAGPVWSRATGLPGPRNLPTVLGLTVVSLGLFFLARHDTESGHLSLLGALGGWAVGSLVIGRLRLVWTLRRVRIALAAAWALPVAAAIVPWIRPDSTGDRLSRALVARCRFAETPTDDLERLAAWCRHHTPASSRFIGPPGPKTFRLWSRRSLAFNRGGSPYHAEGLADWSARYRDHVNFGGSTAEFARAYLADRHALEARYQIMTDLQRADLAHRQGASHVLAAAPPRDARRKADGPLELLHIEGLYAAYRVRPIDGEPRCTERPAMVDRPGERRNFRENFVGLPFHWPPND